MIQGKPTITLKEARRLAKHLHQHGEAHDVKAIRRWTIFNIRAVWLWIRLRDNFPIVGAIRELDDFLAMRQGLRFCMVCGCTEDNPCLDPGFDIPCSWVGDFLCSACLSQEGAGQ